MSSIDDDPIQREEPHLPPAPVNVRLVTMDGVEHPVEVVYHGLANDGVRQIWVTTSRLKLGPEQRVREVVANDMSRDAVVVVLGRRCVCGECE